MARPHITPVVPTTEQEYQVYHGNLALSHIEAVTELGEMALMSYYDVMPLGMGAEKVVYPHKDRSDQVVAFYKDRGDGSEGLSAYELKSRYYTIRLMHVLLPDNIPDAHLVGTNPRGMHLDAVAHNPMDEETFKRLYEDLRTKAGALGVFLDPKRSNFVLGDDGKLKYVDDFGLPEDFTPIEVAISKIEDETMRERAQRYASRALGSKKPQIR